jgi:hypothetical protein
MDKMNAVCGEAASLFEMADYANVIFDFLEVFWHCVPNSGKAPVRFCETYWSATRLRIALLGETVGQPMQL